MSTDTALIEKREELKRRLAAGEYKTLVDIFLKWVDRVIRKITRRASPLPIWYITGILSLAVILIHFASIYISGIEIFVRNFYKPYGPGGMFATIMSEVLAVTSVVVINQYVHALFTFWRENALDAIESEASLDEFNDWLKKACNWRLHLLMTVIGASVGSLYMAASIGALLGLAPDFASLLVLFIVGLFSWAFLYLLLVVLFLSASLRNYELKLFAADPSSSELVFRLSSKLSFIVYLVAVYAACLTLGSAWLGFGSPFIIVQILVLWLPIIALFILNQTSLASIVRRAKWKTLNEIQVKVENLQRSKNFGNQETMDAIKRLMDYHDRVKATRDSALDFRAYLSFINSLLLPLLAFILGNLDLVLKLFARQP